MFFRLIKNLLLFINFSHKKYPVKIIGLWFLLSVQFVSYSQQISEFEAKSAFILKITNFIEWPEEVIEHSSEFTILIYGDSPLNKILASDIKKSDLKIKNKKVIVKGITDIREIKDCQILFISSSEKYELRKILKAIEKSPILTMGDTEGFDQWGIMINIFIKNSIQFNVNKKFADLSDIYISSKLLVHANNVIR